MDPVAANTSRNGRRGATPLAQPSETELETEENPLQLQNNQSFVRPIKELFGNDADPWWMMYLVYIAAPTYNVCRTVLIISKNPIRWLLSAYSVWFILSGATNLAIKSKAVPELLMFWGKSSYRGPQDPPPDFCKFAMLQSQLQGVMEKSTNTLVVVINIKRSEVAVRDLRVFVCHSIVLVKQSSLVGKERLAKSLEEFVEDARTTGRSLQKFGGHVEGAVDEAITMSEYTIELLARAAQDERFSFLMNLLLPHVVEARKKYVKSMWIREIRKMKSTVGRLMKEATANTRALDRLENKLNAIRTIVTRDNMVIAEGKETLSALWTALGGNKAQLAEFESHIQLLNNVSGYRKAAMDHVTGALVHLERIDWGLKTLDEPVASPPIPSQAEEIPLEVHVIMMLKGVNRLMEARVRERGCEREFMCQMFGGNYP